MDCIQIHNIINVSKNILIISHINPDGDTLGSMCGMYSAIIDNFKKKAEMLLMSDCPEIFKFLPYISEAKHLNDFDKSREYDLVINVDVASENRMFDSAVLFKKAKHTINIDHHITNEAYAEYNFISPEASSTGEILYMLMSKMGWKISENTAACLYTAILTDTGAFKYSNTTSTALKTAAGLVELGVIPSAIYQFCYESMSKNIFLFQAYCISNAIFSDDNKIAYINIFKKDMERFNAAEDCTEGLTEKLRSVKTVEVAFIVKQLSNTLSKISMRSEKVDISTVCSKFGGGGHKLAAGCLIKAGVKEAAKMVLEEVKKLRI